MGENIRKSKGKEILDFIIKTMNGMAYGLFSTLIVGTILATIGGFFNQDLYISKIIISVAKFLQNMTGVGIGLGVAWSLKLDGLKLITIAAVGAIASYLNLNIYNPDINEYIEDYGNVKLDNTLCVDISFPGYFDLIKNLHI